MIFFYSKEDLRNPTLIFIDTDYRDDIKSTETVSTRREQLLSYGKELMSYDNHTNEEIIIMFIETLLRLSPLDFIKGLSILYKKGYTNIIKKYSKLYKKYLMANFETLYKNPISDYSQSRYITDFNKDYITYHITNFDYLIDDNYKKPYINLYLNTLLDSISEFIIDKILSVHDTELMQLLLKDRDSNDSKNVIKNYETVILNISNNNKITNYVDNRIKKDPSLYIHFRDINLLNTKLQKKYKYLDNADKYDMFK